MLRLIESRRACFLPGWKIMCPRAICPVLSWRFRQSDGGVFRQGFDAVSPVQMSNSYNRSNLSRLLAKSDRFC